MLYENGEFERIRPHLTPLECGIIFHGIPEGAISRKVGLIWGIPAISSAYGVHPAWFAAAATAPGIRECKRLAFLSATLPLARIIADELSSKLETRIEIEWPNMANESVDVHLRARAFAAIVSAGEGQSPTYAAAVAGLPIPPAEDDEIRMAQHTRRHEDSKEHGESTSYENGRFLGPMEYRQE